MIAYISFPDQTNRLSSPRFDDDNYSGMCGILLGAHGFSIVRARNERGLLRSTFRESHSAVLSATSVLSVINKSCLRENTFSCTFSWLVVSL